MQNCWFIFLKHNAPYFTIFRAQSASEHIINKDILGKTLTALTVLLYNATFFFLFLEIAPRALSSLQVHFGTCENMLKVTQKRKRLMRHTAVAYFRPHKQNMILLILSIQT